MSKKFLAVLFLLVGTTAASRLSENRKTDALAKHLETVPLAVSDWTGAPDPRLPDYLEAKLAATEYLSRTYRQGSNRMTLLISYYAQQRAGETMHSPRACLPGGGWEPWDYAQMDIPVAGKTVTVNRYAVQKDNKRMQVLYWYQSRQRIIASEYTGKVMLLWDSLTGGYTGGALVRLMVDDGPQAVPQLTQFASALIPEVQECLGR